MTLCIIIQRNIPGAKKIPNANLETFNQEHKMLIRSIEGRGLLQNFIRDAGGGWLCAK
jgi:hypothetical protein